MSVESGTTLGWGITRICAFPVRYLRCLRGQHIAEVILPNSLHQHTGAQISSLDALRPSRFPDDAGPRGHGRPPAAPAPAVEMSLWETWRIEP